MSNKITYYFESGKVTNSLNQGNIIFSIEPSNSHIGFCSDTKTEVLHRLDVPAIEYPNGYEAYYLHGVRHRLDGPAVVHPEIKKNFYFLFGVRYSKQEFKNQIKNLDNNILYYLLCQDPLLRKVAQTSFKALYPNKEFQNETK